jgi:A/G-specific adenine glycosylase
MDLSQDHKLLLQWYKQNARDLPWRKNKNPYAIWLSEVMLQQTTVTAVIPYFEKFLQLFPNVQDLAAAAEADVLQAWAGLGYYSRARNLHKSAKALAVLPQFPQTAEELLQLPGFGPYTSRAVASIAFQEPVGVLDGNVIRVLSRRFDLKTEWWKTLPRQQLQQLSDQLAQLGSSNLANQALMELGATICTPKKVSCLLCPWTQNCLALKNKSIADLPLQKPRKAIEVWVWQPQILQQKNKILLVKNNYAPFLKGQWIFPGQIHQQKSKPKDYTTKHSITHHEIFVVPHNKHRAVRPPDSAPIAKVFEKTAEQMWVAVNDLKKINPSSLLTKTLDAWKS